MIVRLTHSAWNYRGFISGSVKREFQARYRNSLLGIAWTLLTPLAMVVVYTVIFSQVMRSRLPGLDDGLSYSIFLCAGILTWGLHAEITSRSLTMFLENANLIKKINFPRICLPIIISVNGLINFIIIITIFSLFLVFFHRFPGPALLALPALVALQILFSAGLGISLGVVNVFFRDVGQLMGIVLQFWFWFTPIVYPLSILPTHAQEWVWLNPLSPLMYAYQQLFLKGAWPDWQSLLPLLACSVVLCALGMALFRRRSGEMVDEL